MHVRGRHCSDRRFSVRALNGYLKSWACARYVPRDQAVHPIAVASGRAPDRALTSCLSRKPPWPPSARRRDGRQWLPGTGLVMSHPTSVARQSCRAGKKSTTGLTSSPGPGRTRVRPKPWKDPPRLPPQGDGVHPAMLGSARMQNPALVDRQGPHGAPPCGGSAGIQGTTLSP